MIKRSEFGKRYWDLLFGEVLHSKALLVVGFFFCVGVGVLRDYRAGSNFSRVLVDVRAQAGCSVLAVLGQSRFSEGVFEPVSFESGQFKQRWASGISLIRVLTDVQLTDDCVSVFALDDWRGKRVSLRVTAMREKIDSRGKMDLRSKKAFCYEVECEPLACSMIPGLRGGINWNGDIWLVVCNVYRWAGFWLFLSWAQLVIQSVYKSLKAVT